VTTIGMNYEVIEGKQETFENAVTKVVHAMRNVDGHERTWLFKDVHNPRRYLILSQWTSKATFDAFVASETFRKVTAWGKEQILARRPHHEVYGSY
jgi:heme-degrading monooxygenase HmoA